MSVTVPTNKELKAQDIASKLKLYGIYCGFASQKLPSNRQVDVAMNSALNSDLLQKPDKNLSQEGKILVADLRDIIQQAKMLFLTKNKDENLQKFIFASTNVGSKGGVGAPTSKDQAQQDAQKAAQGFRTLGTLLITNGQFRKLLSDAMVLAQDIGQDAATKAAGKIGPSEDAKQNLHEPAPDHTWHDAPDIQGAKDKYYNMKNSAKGAAKEDANAVGNQASQSADPSSDAQGTAQKIANDQARGTSSGVDAQKGAMDGAKTLKDRLSSRIPDERKDQAKDKVKQTTAQTKEYMRGKMPPERRDAVIYRLKKMIVEIQQHEDYGSAIDALLDLAAKYKGHAQTVASDGSQAAADAHNDDTLASAEYNIKLLIERFANYTSLDDLIDAIDQIYQDAKEDNEFMSYFRQLNKYIRKCLKEEGFVLRDEATQEWNDLQEKGKYFVNDKYKTHFDDLQSEFQLIIDQFGQDSDSVRFGNSMQKLFDDLGTDENGKATFKPNLLSDVFNVVLPTVFDRIRYVPIPRIEYSDPMIDAVIENLVLEAANIFPTNIEISTDQFHRLRMHKQTANVHKQVWTVKMSEIQADLKDVAYYVKKKEGFPGVTDKGLADFYMGGAGMEATFKIALNDAVNSNHLFDVKSCVVKANHMQISLKQSRHKTLFNLFKPILMTVMKPVVEKVAAVRIRQMLDQLDGELYQIQKDVKRSKEHVKQNPEDAQDIFNQYWSAIQSRITQAQDKGKEKSRNTTTNVAITKKDSIFKNVSLPGGISNKATEYKEIAAKGTGWQSSVFDLGSTKTTSNIPDPKPITRKSPRQGKYYGNASSKLSNTIGKTHQGDTDSGVSTGTYSRDNSDFQSTSGMTGGKSNMLSSESTRGMTGGKSNMLSSESKSEMTGGKSNMLSSEYSDNQGRGFSNLPATSVALGPVDRST